MKCLMCIRELFESKLLSASFVFMDTQWFPFCMLSIVTHLFAVCSDISNR